MEGGIISASTDEQATNAVAWPGGYLRVEVMLHVVVHVEIEEAAHPVRPKRSCAVDDGGRVLLHLGVLDDVEHQHDRAADEPRQHVEPEHRPAVAGGDQSDGAEVDEAEETRVAGHLRQLRRR
ncbi:MAG: hypothetical protein OXK73_07655 [Rhodospirillaceae bacterium]|nr:hypothetical protein [Rhodospirillaceae bacterium]